jgi:hypothetical protein
MAAGEQPPRHVGAHAPKSDDSKLHNRLLQSADCSAGSGFFLWVIDGRLQGASFTSSILLIM